MTPSWNEIRDRALHFSREWADAHNEEADAKPFLVAFFNVFGISNRRVSTFEHRVKRLDSSDGYIDLLWKGMILIEMKSLGKSLDKAYTQAAAYIHGLKEHEVPKYILVCDFQHFRLHDLEDGRIIDFKLSELAQHVQHFSYLLGYQRKIYKEQDPANIKAAELMGKLHDRLEEIGYIGHPLEVYLVRLLFCLFAEDTSIFNRQQFQEYIEQRTSEDGSDLAARLQELFQVLNTPSDKRFKNLDEHLADFPYVNGRLFEEILPTASFDRAMRQALLNCCYIDWSKISPAIFGSMFQSVMNPRERRNLGAHYTSEKNILKLIKPLFLDELWTEFETIKGNKNKLTEFHKKLGTLRFLDPACGCGNFLVITYRELRLLEIEVLKAMNKTGQGFLDVREIIQVDVDQFSGIEYEEFPAQIAQVAMWLIDHQMNMLVSHEFGQYFVRLPLQKSAKIVHGNALRIPWQSLLNEDNWLTVHADEAHIFRVGEPELRYGKVNVFARTVIEGTEASAEVEITFHYIIGNPPFIGSKMMSDEQRQDLLSVFGNISGAGTLDYVAAWYWLGCKYITENPATRVAFVSTNSVTQGEQVGVVWNRILKDEGLQIHFAHQTFQWNNEGRGKAAVHCVIIGYGKPNSLVRRLFLYSDAKADPVEISASYINAYLVDGPDVIVSTRQKPLCPVPEIGIGNKPIDGGHYLFTTTEKEAFIRLEPEAEKWFRRWLGSDEFINRWERWCLWLGDCPPEQLKAMPEALKRVKAVQDFRLKSKSMPTRKLAQTPTRFHVENMPESEFLLIPRVSSERRAIIPIGYIPAKTLASDSVHIVENATRYHFGVVTSRMHMVWVKNIAGRLKSDFRYSKDIVYNNFPWPENPTDKQIKAVESAAQKVLDTRAQFPDNSLADLYDPLTMPPALSKAHNELDKAVDLAYRAQPFTSDPKRMEFLFELYEKYTAGLFSEAGAKKRSRKG